MLHRHRHGLLRIVPGRHGVICALNGVILRLMGVILGRLTHRLRIIRRSAGRVIRTAQPRSRLSQLRLLWIVIGWGPILLILLILALLLELPVGSFGGFCRRKA